MCDSVRETFVACYSHCSQYGGVDYEICHLKVLLLGFCSRQTGQTNCIHKPGGVLRKIWFPQNLGGRNYHCICVAWQAGLARVIVVAATIPTATGEHFWHIVVLYHA